MNYLAQFFEFRRLPKELLEVGQAYYILASKVLLLPDNPEKTTALRKLLESRDCAFRAVKFEVKE